MSIINNNQITRTDIMANSSNHTRKNIYHYTYVIQKELCNIPNYIVCKYENSSLTYKRKQRNNNYNISV